MDDHDLLIRLDQNVLNLTREVQNIGSNTINRLNEIDKDKVDVTDFEEFKKNLATEMAKAYADAAKTHQDMNKAAEDLKRDLETRMRAVEKFMYITLGITTVLDIVLIPVGFFLLNKFF